LDHGEKYWYLNQHNEWSDEKQEDDLREWRKTYSAMKVIGISEQVPFCIIVFFRLFGPEKVGEFN